MGLDKDIHEKQAVGYSSMQLWHRLSDKDTKESRDYKRLPVEEKESYKWIKCATDNKSVLSEASSVTLVGDRESDMYELFTDATAQGLDLIVRSRTNRRTPEQRKHEDKTEKLKNKNKHGTLKWATWIIARLGG